MVDLVCLKLVLHLKQTTKSLQSAKYQRQKADVYLLKRRGFTIVILTQSDGADDYIMSAKTICWIRTTLPIENLR